MKAWRRAAAALGVLCSGPLAQAHEAAPDIPAYDHVVVLILENHTFEQILGSAQAPYLERLAAQGAVFTDAHGVTHPSQPNYLALFAGSTFGVQDDGCLPPLQGANLAAQLLAAGKTFVGYSEDLPAAGSVVCTSGAYARKHNPWVNFRALPPEINQPFTAFPGDFRRLPVVAFVVPNLEHDMHDGTVAQGDAWAQAALDGYARWAVTHNSLLIVTFDEDDYASPLNRIPMIFYGAHVRPGRYDARVDHYNVLATLEAIEHLPRLTSAPPVTAVFR